LADEEAAAESIASGAYGAQVERFVTILRTPPASEAHDVSFADAPSAIGVRAVSTADDDRAMCPIGREAQLLARTYSA
jgi:hypothetical protein